MQDAGLGYETARRYLEVLEDTLVAFRVPAWSGSDRASLIAHPKIFVFDLGVRNALLRRPLDRPLEDERGLLLEHLVGYELHRRLGTLWPEATLSYYRTRHGVEVDFVLQVGREVWAIEVKASRDVTRSALLGLASFGGTRSPGGTKDRGVPGLAPAARRQGRSAAADRLPRGVAPVIGSLADGARCPGASGERKGSRCPRGP